MVCISYSPYAGSLTVTNVTGTGIFESSGLDQLAGRMQRIVAFLRLCKDEK